MPIFKLISACRKVNFIISAFFTLFLLCRVKLLENIQFKTGHYKWIDQKDKGTIGFVLIFYGQSIRQKCAFNFKNILKIIDFYSKLKKFKHKGLFMSYQSDKTITPILSEKSESEMPILSFKILQNLMRYRIRTILLVSSLYDLYMFEEDGRLYEMVRKEYQGLNLSQTPEIIRISSGKEALKLLKKEAFDLVLTTLHIEEISSVRMAKRIKENFNIPVVLLAYDNRELIDMMSGKESSIFDQVFMWTGDFRIIVTIIKYLEDRANVKPDTKLVGVQTIILIEDNIRFYSSYLPLLYGEILAQTQNLINEGINLRDKFLRMRARPKILFCTNYEEAWSYFEKYEEHILGIISDINFYKNGKKDPKAGFKFAKNVKKRHSDISVLLQSTDPKNREKAEELGASFLLKGSPTLLNELKKFIRRNFGFGDFVFRDAEGNEVARAKDLTALENLLKTVPAEIVKYHSLHNHFSIWLKARTEFWLAEKLRPQKWSDFKTLEDLRDSLVESLETYRKSRQKGVILDFKKDTFDPEIDFSRIGGGSLGGKARGLNFLNMLIANHHMQYNFQDIIVDVPPGVVLGTDAFDAFMNENDLWDFALNCNDNYAILKKFVEAEKFPKEIMEGLSAFIDLMKTPLAIRSSSLLEDSQYHPFAGVYDTYMIPNKNPDTAERLNELIIAIKKVYASTYYKHAKDYINATSFRHEEEKMAVIIQKMIGTQYGTRFYPTFSGVAKSYNFYPLPPQSAEDGIVAVALGLGRIIVEGGNCLKFSPRHPNHLQNISGLKDILNNNQQKFYALDMTSNLSTIINQEDLTLRRYNLKDAEQDGVLYYIASTYSYENNALYDGISRQGARILTFAPILKYKIFPLPDILNLLLDMGSRGMGSPIEIEFAVNISKEKGKASEFSVLQMRPLALKQSLEKMDLTVEDEDHILCHSPKVLGHGAIDDIYDIIFVDYHLYNRAKSREAAEEISDFNTKLRAQKRPYLLIGVGRWGSADPWLGIPVTWDQISGAKTIVESSFKDFMVEPSQGSHFFHNITSFMVGYFTVNAFKEEGFVDWDWLLKQPAVETKIYSKHIRFDEPVIVKMNGKENKGIIIKPGNGK